MDFILDLRTLSFVVAVVSLVSLVVMVTIWRINQRQPGMRHWLLAGLFSVPGFLVMPAVVIWRQPLLEGVWISQSFALLALSCVLAGSLRFRGFLPRLRWPWLLLIPAVQWLCLLWIGQRPAGRYLVHDLLALGLLLATALTFGWRSTPEQRPVFRLAVGLQVLLATALAWRWGLAWQLQDDLAVLHNPWQGGFYLLVVVYNIGLTYTISLVCYQQAHLRTLSLAQQDALTGLPNRRSFDDTLDREVSRAERSGSRFGLVMIDLNGFKQVNDRYGHAAGDALLIEVARRLRLVARSGDFVARLGGDEFCVLLHDLEAADALPQALGRLQELVNGPAQVLGHAVTIEASFGAAVWPQDGAQPGELMKQADERMYRQKAELKAARLALAARPGMA